MTSWESILAASLQRQWKDYRRTLQECQRRFSERAVHDSRVECRRLMSVFELLRVLPLRGNLRKKARGALQEHLDAFDRLRDTQVQLLLLGQQADAFPETRGLRAALREREERCRTEAKGRLRKIKTGRVKKLATALRQRLDALHLEPDRRLRARRAILRAVDAAFARAVDLRHKMDPGQVATLHRARVAFKKFRYMAEAVRPLLPGFSTWRLEAMHSFQEMFGALQDTDVFLARLDKFAGQDQGREQTLAAFRHWLLRRRTAQIERCLKHADAMLEFWPPAPAASAPRPRS